MADSFGAMLNRLAGSGSENVPLFSEMIRKNKERELSASEIKNNILAKLMK